jgi:hypothetical protein
MTKMAEEYHERTRAFSGIISQRLPFLLFKNLSDYRAAGGMPGSAGVFDGEKLMAVAGDKVSGRTWHVVQHEGFHQFAHAVIRGDIPMWANEGLAEYFGEGVFTGDGFVTGLIPASRLDRVKKTMQDAHGFMSVTRMMTVSNREWNSNLTMENYDQAWSMVHFLAHGDNGKYQNAFTGYMRDVGRGRPSPIAWRDNFGDAAGFEQRWRDYWMNLPDNPTLDLYVKASVSTLTSVIARTTAEKQTFDNFEDFSRLANEKKLKISDADWLPPSLAIDALHLSDNVGKWSIEVVAKQPTIVAELDDGTRIVGSFASRGTKVERVWVDVDDLKPTLAKAEALVTAGQKEKARALVQEAMRRSPKSPAIEQARHFMADHK